MGKSELISLLTLIIFETKISYIFSFIAEFNIQKGKIKLNTTHMMREKRYNQKLKTKIHNKNV